MSAGHGEDGSMAAQDAAEVTDATFSGAEHSAESFAPHSHDQDQLYWFPDGGMEVVVGGHRWLVHSDTMLWIPAGTLHSNRLLGPGATVSIYLNPRLRPTGEKWARTRALRRDPLIAEIMRHIPGRALSPTRREACARLLLDLLGDADDRETTLPLPVHPAARAVAEAIVADPGEQRSLSDWAALHGVSSRTLARAFESQTGHGFARWRTRTRLLSSLSSLMAGTPVHLVGSTVGFATAGGYIEAFAKEFGVTPGEYVRLHRR